MKPSAKRRRTQAEIGEDRLADQELLEERESFLSSKKKFEDESKKKDLQLQEADQYK